MKKLSLTLFCCLLVAMTAWAQSSYDALAPFGFATCTSRTNAGTYNITGGGAMTYEEALASSSKIVLTSDGTTAMDDIIKNAIKNYSVIIFDGSNNTDFWLNQYIAFDGLKNKTLIGVNGARLCTQFYLTSEIHQMLNNYPWEKNGTTYTGVKKGSTSSGSNKFGNLPNGQSVGEESEYLTRKALIEYLNDNNENFRKAGVFQFKNCENFIIRNLKFVGPGPCDVGGYDLMSMSTSSHFWVDHCEFTDGIDGNFDITNNSDFSTISWCTFAYTERAYAHMNTNLVGSSDSDGMLDGSGYYLNLTWAYNHWGSGCDQRMPMARAGKIHMLNNYYTCTNNSSSINPRKNSEFYIEGNYFADGVKKVFSQTDATAYQWISSGNRANVIASSGVSTPSSSGTVAIPYEYDNTLAAANVPTEVGKWAGATLFKAQPTSVVVSPANKTIEVGSTLQLFAQVLPAGADYSVTWNSEKSSVAEVDATGKVTAKAIGTAKITATTANGFNDYCLLTVVAKQTGGTKTIYSWESPNGNVIQSGGTIAYVNGDGNRLNYANGGYYTICLNGKKANINDATASANAGHMEITLNEPLAASDRFTVTAYYKKGEAKNVSMYMLFDNGKYYTTENFTADIAIANTVPETKIFTIEGIEGSRKISLTRDATETNLFITKIEIVREGSSPSTLATITKYISSAEWASFVPTENVIVPEDVNIYYAKTSSYNGNSVVAVPVEAGQTIAKNTGFFVNGSEGNHVFTVSTETPMAISDNMLSCGANAKIANGSLVFGRNYINSILTTGFFPLTSYDIQLPEGIVYIDATKLSGNQAKAISVIFDEATDIRSANEATGYGSQAIGIYNLSGQKVDNNYKGIVIINGRKVWKR